MLKISLRLVTNSANLTYFCFSLTAWQQHSCLPKGTSFSKSWSSCSLPEGPNLSVFQREGKIEIWSNTLNHRMAWVQPDLKDHLVPTFLPWARIPSTRPGCLKPHPTWPGKVKGLGIHNSPDNLLQCLTTFTVTNFCLKSNLNLHSTRVKPFASDRTRGKIFTTGPCKIPHSFF